MPVGGPSFAPSFSLEECCILEHTRCDVQPLEAAWGGGQPAELFAAPRFSVARGVARMRLETGSRDLCSATLGYSAWTVRWLWTMRNTRPWCNRWDHGLRASWVHAGSSAAAPPTRPPARVPAGPPRWHAFFWLLRRRLPLSLLSRRERRAAGCWRAQRLRVCAAASSAAANSTTQCDWP